MATTTASALSHSCDCSTDWGHVILSIITLLIVAVACWFLIRSRSRAQAQALARARQAQMIQVPEAVPLAAPPPMAPAQMEEVPEAVPPPTAPAPQQYPNGAQKGVELLDKDSSVPLKL